MLLLLRNGADKDIRDKKGKTFEDYTKEFDTRSYTQLIMDMMKSRMPEEEQEPKDDIPQMHQSFMERFDWYLSLYQKRYPERSRGSSAKRRLCFF